MSLETKRAFTTGEVAKICGVNFRTVIRWIQRGQLKGYKLPGRGDHRVVLEDLKEFCEQNSIPVPYDLDASLSKKILIVEQDHTLAHAMERLLAGQGYATEKAKNAFFAGAMLHQFSPDLITLDLNLPGIGGLEVLKYIKQTPHFQKTRTLIICDQPHEEHHEAIKLGADQILKKPFRGESFLNQVAELLAQPLKLVNDR